MRLPALARCGLEMDVAPAAVAAFGCDIALLVFGEVGEGDGSFALVVGVEEQRADGNADDLAFPVSALLATPGAVLALRRLDFAFVAEGLQCVYAAIRDEDDVAAAAAITAVGPAHRDELLASE